MTSKEKKLLNKLKSINISLIVCVPCINLKSFIDLIQKDKTIQYISVTREEEGVGICCGYWISGKKSILLIQNSGIGNSINALMSLNRLYRIPLVMLISFRGDINEKMIGQIPMGAVTKPLLKTLDIDYYDLKYNDHIELIIENTFSNRKISSILIDSMYWNV